LEVLRFVSILLEVDPPSGGVSPLAWVIIGALIFVIATVIPALWIRGNKIEDRMYSDLKKCNEKRNASEEEIVSVLKVLRLQMEQSKGGPKR
jgi:hypothetical protein